MSDADQLLDQIESAIVSHGGDLGGWTRRADDTLQLFDGRVTLRAAIEEPPSAAPDKEGVVHAHVSTTLHEHDDEVLDACLFGMGDTRDAAIGQAAVVWLTCVAGPIKSFLDNKPVCMTVQAGVQDGDFSQGYSASDYGLPGLRAFVGPAIFRFVDDTDIQSAIDDTKPWFRHAAESAAPRRVHLAKSTVTCAGKKGWRRELEIDGHDVSHKDPDWPTQVVGPEFGYVTRYAVFEFPRNSSEIRRRAELERTILHFAKNYPRFEQTNDLMIDMVANGFDAALVHETEAFATIAFGRVLFEHMGVQYANTVIRARGDGRVEVGVPLMAMPAYSRARALVPRIAESMTEDEFQMLGLYNAESHIIMQVLEQSDGKADLSKITLYPSVVPDRDVSEQTMNAAMTALNQLVESERAAKGGATSPKSGEGKRDGAESRPKKPWWKIW